MARKTSSIELTIDPEFAALGRKLTPEEQSLLETDLEQAGCQDAIITWANSDVILDGHTRYKICRELGITYTVKALTFADRREAREWIITHQLGRRNCSEDDKAYLRGKRYRAEKHQGERTDLTFGHDVQKSSTAEKLADEFGVDEKTIRRDAEYASALDTLAENTGDETRDAIRSGQLGVSKKDAVKLAALSPAKQKAAIKKGEDGIRAAVTMARQPTGTTLVQQMTDAMDALTRSVQAVTAAGVDEAAETLGAECEEFVADLRFVADELCELADAMEGR